MSACSSYVTYKDQFKFEEYITKLNKSERITLCKLRLNINKLPIVLGRHQNIPRIERICNKCDRNLIGDEYHVVLECDNQEIVNLRNRYIPAYYRNYPNRNKFIALMNSKGKKTLSY